MNEFMCMKMSRLVHRTFETPKSIMNEYLFLTADSLEWNIGIGVSIGVLGLILLLILICFIVRRRQ